MSRQIIIAEQHRIAAVFAEDQIQELIVASGNHQVGDVYLGVVENVLPSIDAAFVNIGNTERNGFIHVTDLGPLRLRRSSASITELVTPQQKVLVQVMKEPTGNKGPRLTGNLSFPGRYLVLMPYGKGVHLSRRIEDREERNRLKSLAILIKPAQMGLLVRTEAEDVPEEAMIEDLEQLKKQWEYILQQQSNARGPGLLNRDEDFVQRVLRDVYSADVNRIVTDSPLGLKRVRQYLQSWNKGQMPAGVFVDAHREPTPILEYFRINAVIRQALRPRVDLPSGGYIIIEPTEALTVIDVNSGSFTQSATSRETVLWTNCEAATEIARQLRLRNIAGVIVVDFIDMDSRRDQLQALEHFNKALHNDKARPQVAQLSELGLVELTRKRQGQSLYEIFGRPCPTCEGLGLLAHLPGSHPDAVGIALESGRTAVLSGETDPLADSETGSFPRERNGGSRSQPRGKGLRPSSEIGRRGRSLPRRGEVPPAAFGDSLPFLPSGIDPADLLEDTPEPIWDPLAAEAPPSEGSRDKLIVRNREEGRGRPTPSERGRLGGGINRGRGREGVGDPVLAEASAGLELRPRESQRRLLTIPMTPLQQKVYAEMGLSPLLLVKPSVAPSRDLVVQVVLPNGEDTPASLSPAIELDRLPPELPLSPPEDRDDFEDVPPMRIPEVSLAEESVGDPLPGEVVAPPAPPEGILPPEQQSPAASRRRRSRSKG
ncbi:MAG: Rne/Rng family ribonuclease [Cyanobacteriota bacterium]|nr:Rne/Rng family ribonuclease [Cyanobacteriota bacterium]